MYGDRPLEAIVPDHGAFMTFLQQQWDRFLRDRAGQAPRLEPMTFAGPADLPFEHPDIRAYVNSLCLEGGVEPVQGIPRAALGDGWLAVGLLPEAREDIGGRFKN